MKNEEHEFDSNYPSANAAQLDLLKEAREANNTWKFQEKEYELYLVNQTGGIQLPIKDDENKTTGFVGAEFSWNEAMDVLEAIDYDPKEENDIQKGVSRTRSNNANILLSRVFRNTVQRGVLIELDDLGERMEPIELDHDGIIEATEQEIHASLVFEWLNRFYVTRFFEKGASKFKALIKAQDSIKFIVRIGDLENPRHLLLMEFAAPSKDARRDYEQRVRDRERTQDGNTVTNHIIIDNEYKLQFAKKYFRDVQGVTLNDIATPFVAADDNHVKAFKKGFNPVWWVTLADKLVGAFDSTGK